MDLPRLAVHVFIFVTQRAHRAFFRPMIYWEEISHNHKTFNTVGGTITSAHKCLQVLSVCMKSGQGSIYELPIFCLEYIDNHCQCPPLSVGNKGGRGCT